MAETSKIQWTNATWNPITGCSMVSAGCQRCYAMRLAGGRLKNHSSRRGLTTETPNGPVWNGEVRFNERWLDQPTIWRTPKRIFVVAHGDLFHENVPTDWIDRVFATMAEAPQHTYQILTKRPGRMRQYIRSRTEHCGAPPDNWWFGTSAEDQATADLRIPLLPLPVAGDRVGMNRVGILSLYRVGRRRRGVDRAAREVALPITWLSAEPLLGPIKLGHMVDYLDWVVIGGESGPGARPMVDEWAVNLIRECQENGVAVFMKQLSQYNWPYKYKAFDEWRPELRVREYPRGMV